VDEMRRMKAIAYATIAFGVAIAITAPLELHKAGFAPQRHVGPIAAMSEDNEGLLFPRDGATDPEDKETRRAGASNWLKFETDSCGLPSRTEDRHSMSTQSAFADDSDDVGDGDDVDESWAIIGKWLSEHPDIAVISDGVEKSCDYDSIEDYDYGPDFLTDWRVPASQRLGTRRDIFYIA